MADPPRELPPDGVDPRGEGVGARFNSATVSELSQTAPYIDQLETEMDTMNESLEDLSSFILPGGGEISARTHLARCVCRRAERQTLRINDEHSLDGTEIPYLNRLSDWLFVAGRYIAHEQGFKETLW